MLDPSVVLSKGGGSPQRLVLSPAAPEVIVDAGSAGASVATVGGTVLSATIDNTFTPGTWAAASNPQAIASGRRAFKLGGPDHAPITITWS